MSNLFNLMNDIQTSSQSTHEALQQSSTYEIMTKWWDTSIALSAFVSSLLLAVFTSMTLFLLKNHYKELNKKNPFVRPVISALTVIAALTVGWIVEMFGRDDAAMQITYFSISLSPVIGRWAFESMIHPMGWTLVSKGLIYICGMHILGIVIGMYIGKLIIYLIDKRNPQLGYSINSTFLYKPLKTSNHALRNLATWFFIGATVPFCGYLMYIKGTNGVSYFSPLSSTMCALVIIFIMMFFTHEVGYFDGNLAISLYIQFTNIFELKNPNRKQIIKNIPISAAFSLGLPFIFGILYGVLYNTNI